MTFEVKLRQRFACLKLKERKEISKSLKRSDFRQKKCLTKIYF